MSVTVEARHDYDFDLETVIEAFTDPEFYEAKFEGVGARKVEVLSSDRDDDVFTVETRRDVPLEVPGFLKKVLGEWNTMIQSERWDQLAKEILDRGDFMPDEIMLHLIEERLAKPDVENCFLLDGYPRNLVQAEALDALLEKLGKPLDEAVQIDVDPERILARILRRAAEEHRSDDSEEVFRHRMEVYEEQTAPVAEYYAERGLLTRILGHGSPEEVHQLLLSVLDLDEKAC